MSARLAGVVIALMLAVAMGVWMRGTAPSAGHRTTGPSLADGPRETFSVVYSVVVRDEDPSTASVRWELAGVDEVQQVRLRVDPERFDEFHGSGVVEQERDEVRWTPGGPYAHLTYRAALNHRRAPGKGYDSYAGDGWVVTRTRALFPRSTVVLRTELEPEAESRARLTFRLPPTWDVVTAMPAVGPRTFEVESPHSRFDHPHGWLMMGRFERIDAEVAGTTVSVAAPPGVPLPPRRVLGFLAKAMPVMHGLFDYVPPRLLIVSGPDPMWRGGLSGEASFYMHADRPLRTPDRTSPYLHELFHVLATFRPAADAQWVTEGLAEFYSLEVQRRIGQLDERGYARGLQLFARYGAWGRNFTRAPSNAVRNNSAPLVMYALDRRMRQVSDGARGLDDAVVLLAREGGAVSTARFLGAVRRVTGRNFGAFFRRHVYRGERPDPRDIAPPTPAPAAGSGSP